MSTVEDKPGLIVSILNWLRKGYPDGVPPTDYFPLLALLSRRLTDAELDTIVADLTQSGHLTADRDEVFATIGRVARQDPTEEDLSQVAARLAAAGWPLADAPGANGGRSALVGKNLPDDNGAGARPAFLSSILGWLRAGYPSGVPAQDYIPLLALLRRRLSDDETLWVAKEIVASGHAPVGGADIGVLITKVTNEMPSDDDVNRVRRHLEAAGWPVVQPPAS